LPLLQPGSPVEQPPTLQESAARANPDRVGLPAGVTGTRGHTHRQGGSARIRSSSYHDWLSTRKNLSSSSGAALALAADGYLYAVAADGSDRGWYPADRVPPGHLISNP